MFHQLNKPVAGDMIATVKTNMGEIKIKLEILGICNVEKSVLILSIASCGKQIRDAIEKIT